MPDLPADLPRLRILETYLRLQLRAVQNAIAVAEALENPERTSAPADGPQYWVQWQRRGKGLRPVGWLHRRGCFTEGEPDLDREQAVAMLGRDDVMPCTACWPDRDLRGDHRADPPSPVG